MQKALLYQILVFITHGNIKSSCNNNKLLMIINNDYQQDSTKSFSSRLEIAPTNFIFLKLSNSEFQEIKVYFTGQNNQPIEIKHRIILTLVIK